MSTDSNICNKSVCRKLECGRYWYKPYIGLQSNWVYATNITYEHGTWIVSQVGRVVCCRLGEWSDRAGQHHVCCLCWVLHNPSVQHGHRQSTRRSHRRWRNERSTWHRRLSRRSSTVRRRLGRPHWLERYLASIVRWSLVREVAADWVNNGRIPRHRALTDVTSSARDVTAV